MGGKSKEFCQAVRRASALLSLLVLLAAARPLSAATGARHGNNARLAGFDGDNHADLAVGVPGEEIRGAT